MDRLLGIPVEALSLSLLVMVAAAFGLIAVLAVRNRVFFRLGTRNVRRRKGRSALIVGGLMLATAIISSALTTGDTMGYTIRSSVLRALGPTDVRVSVAGADLDPALDVSGRMPTPAFDEDVAAQVVDAALALPAVDGAAAAIVDNAGAQNLNRRLTEPRVTVYGADASRSPEFGTVVGSDGTEKTLSDLIPKRVYANRQAADDLGARPGDVIALFAGSSSTPVTVDDVVEFRGAGEDGPAVLMPLDAAQQILGLDGQVHHVLVSNAGDEESGATRTDEVMADLAPAVAPLGLEVDPVKQDGLDVAEEQGNAFMSLFSIFGTFSIAAGILLIFLIFVMLSAERRGEMGIARAVGTQRGHLVQMFVFEGAVYDVLAAAVGSLLGLGIAAVMVEVVGSAFSTEGVAIEHHVRLQSLAAAYGIGVVLTLVVVAFSAWRVSVLDIVSAIRNLPTPIVRKARRSHWLRGAAGVALGGTMAAAGAGAGQGTPFLLGASIVLVSLVPIARALGIGDRTAYTMAGVLLVAWWLLPMRLVESVVGDLSSDFSIWIVAGLMVVLGATWTLMYNADLVLAGVTRVAGRFRPVAPIARMAVAYPLRSRLRTAMTLAMFMLVVYTLVTGTAISGSFISSFDDEEAFGGGFDVRAVAAPVAPIPDPEAAFERVLPDGSVEAVGSQSLVPTEVRQAGAGQEFADYPLRGLDEGFLTATTFDLGARARGFESDEAVWEAVAGEPRLAVVDSFVVPRRDNFNFGAVTDLKLEGFVYEDRVFDPVDLEIH
ncbi:MAG TPA: FtsX-like permease family protein, partial [Acidimicrobiia bacterium]|nr:FtsX-like permease family protein [Acidimicrobiia bacterium]